jgi:hypothetical protein
LDTRLTIPDVCARFAAYRSKPGNECWGTLHVVLDDGNTQDKQVEWCIGHATEKGDADGERLGRILLAMSRTQRGKLPSAVEAHLRSLKENENGRGFGPTP